MGKVPRAVGMSQKVTQMVGWLTLTTFVYVLSEHDGCDTVRLVFRQTESTSKCVGKQTKLDRLPRRKREGEKESVGCGS